MTWWKNVQNNLLSLNFKISLKILKWIRPSGYLNKDKAVVWLVNTNETNSCCYWCYLPHSNYSLLNMFFSMTLYLTLLLNVSLYIPYFPFTIKFIIVISFIWMFLFLFLSVSLSTYFEPLYFCFSVSICLFLWMIWDHGYFCLTLIIT